MGRRYSVRGLAKDRVYDVPTAARIIGVSVGTFRKFPARGLRVVSRTRPILIRGEDLINFLQDQANANKQPTLPHQFFCMRCNGPKEALGGLADYVSLNTKTGRLKAICSGCEGVLSKFSSPAKVDELSDKLEIVVNDIA